MTQSWRSTVPSPSKSMPLVSQQSGRPSPSESLTSPAASKHAGLRAAPGTPPLGTESPAQSVVAFEGRPQVKGGNSSATTPLPLTPFRDHSASLNSSENVTGSHARSPKSGLRLAPSGCPRTPSVPLTARVVPVFLSSRRIVLTPSQATTTTPPVIATPL